MVMMSDVYSDGSDKLNYIFMVNCNNINLMTSVTSLLCIFNLSHYSLLFSSWMMPMLRKWVLLFDNSLASMLYSYNNGNIWRGFG